MGAYLLETLDYMIWVSFVLVNNTLFITVTSKQIPFDYDKV